MAAVITALLDPAPFWVFETSGGGVRVPLRSGWFPSYKAAPRPGTSDDRFQGVIAITGHHWNGVRIGGSFQEAEILDGGFDDLTFQLKPGGKFFDRKLAPVIYDRFDLFDGRQFLLRKHRPQGFWLEVDSTVIINTPHSTWHFSV
jgi:hypothetical protein